MRTIIPIMIISLTTTIPAISFAQSYEQEAIEHQQQVQEEEMQEMQRQQEQEAINRNLEESNQRYNDMMSQRYTSSTQYIPAGSDPNPPANIYR